jgi:hypothetical protein
MIQREKRKMFFLKLLLFACTAGTLWAYSAGPLPGLTGALGESNCQQCHLGNSLNASGGSLSINNVPQNYAPGQTYQIQVVIARSGQQRWGFELAARATSNGQQAGTLTSISAATQIVSSNGIQYIEHTSSGTSLGAAQGSWTFSWTAPAVQVGPIIFAAAGNAANGNFANTGDFIYTTTATSQPPVVNPITLLFNQVAVGGGYTTVINLVNTGDSSVIGKLSLVQNDGSLMTVKLGSVQAASLDINIPSGGAQQITAGQISDTEPARAGWAKLESSGGTPGGVATFRLTDTGVLKTTAGILPSAQTNAATIPVNDDSIKDKHTGYAFVNPGAGNINIRIVLVDNSGNIVQTIRPPSLNPLAAGGHTSGFLAQDLNDANFSFDGTAVAIADGTSAFSVTALIVDQGMLTVIPVIAGKGSGVN